MLAVIGRIGTGGGVGHVIEYHGSTIRSLSMEGRMTVCNMSIEGGARAGMVAPDDTTYEYLEGRTHAPRGAAWDEAVAVLAHPALRQRCPLRQGGRSSRRGAIAPHVSWGTNPAQVAPIDGRRARPRHLRDLRGPRRRGPGPRVHGTHRRHAASGHRRRHRVHRVVHQRPNRGPAGGGAVLDGRQVRPGLRALVVPGSRRVPTRPRPRASTRSSSPPASSGANRGVRCAWP